MKQYLKDFLGNNESLIHFTSITTNQAERDHIKHILGSKFIYLLSNTFS